MPKAPNTRREKRKNKRRHNPIPKRTTRGNRPEFSGEQKLIKSAITNPESIFMTIHGDPLEGKDNKGQPNAITNSIHNVPEGIILVLITPPFSVVYSNPPNDTETWRFFCQKNWISTIRRKSSLDQCSGAEKLRKWGDDINYPMESADSTDPDRSDDEITTETYNARSEIIENMQIFLPNDEYYNQKLTFDRDSIDFNAWYLKPVDRYQDTYSELPQNRFLDGKLFDGERFHQKDEKIDSPPHFNRNYLTRHFGDIDGLVNNQFNTTNKLLRHLAKNRTDKTKPIIVVLNSCSPTSAPDLTGATKNAYSERIIENRELSIQTLYDHLINRIQIYLKGRENFCRIRNNFKKIKGSNNIPGIPSLPLYHYQSQLQRTDKSDRFDLHFLIGSIFGTKTVTPYHNLLMHVYATCELDKRGTIMQQFTYRWELKQWHATQTDQNSISKFHNEDIKSQWRNASKEQFLEKFKNFKNEIKINQRNFRLGFPSPVAETKSESHQQSQHTQQSCTGSSCLTMGGRRKRRKTKKKKKKRKTRKKKKRKNKKTRRKKR